MKCIGATEIAMEYLGKPLPNAILLGSFAALTKKIKIDSVLEAIKMKFSGAIAERNIAATMVAYDRIA
jgi:pyruvate ferredoxin oxidoreductase gamma subunit